MTHASLFSGIAGPEVAAAMLGWDNAFHCEINPFGRKVLEYWFPDSVSYEDITKTDFTQWRGKVDILTGGFPCQPFSLAGERRGREDERYLWPEMCRAIQEIRPTWVVGENVAGITTMVEGGVLSEVGEETPLFEPDNIIHGYELEQTFTIERICGDLERIGYSVQPMLIPAAAVGAPHRRDRIFIIAFAPDSDNSAALRGSETNASQSGEKRLSERDEIQQPGKPINVRQTPDGFTSDTESRRARGLRNEIGKKGTRIGNELFGERGGLSGSKGLSADTFRKRLETYIQSRGDGKKGWEIAERYALYYSNATWAKGTWWNNFPVVSPVHRGNDGIPFRMDRASISFSKWRTESLKAYGNAIVVPVMYRIFQAIEQVSR